MVSGAANGFISESAVEDFVSHANDTRIIKT
jgi:hypothetical protein